MTRKPSDTSPYQAEKRYLQKSWTVLMILFWMMAMFWISHRLTVVDYSYITAGVLFFYLLWMIFIRRLYDK